MKEANLAQIRIVYLYDDADRHSIRLDLFGKSIQAFAEVFEASGDFVLNGNRLRDKEDGHLVSVITDARLHPGSVEIIAYILAAAGAINVISDAGGNIMGLIKFLFSKRSQQDKNDAASRLAANAVEQGNMDRALLRQLLVKSIDALVASQNDNCRKSTAIIGRDGCSGVRLNEIRSSADGTQTETTISDIDLKTRSCYKIPDDPKVEEVEVQIVITALDKVTFNCKYRLHPEADPGDEQARRRLSAKIVDGGIELPGNVYTWSLDFDRPILAKMQVVTKKGSTECLIHSAVRLEE